MQPDYTAQGLSDAMGPQLRALVEQQLRADLRRYGPDSPGLRFDWSDSCVEGHGATHLDGWVDNYSGIAVFDAADHLVAAGWMDFVLDGPFFLAYWDELQVWKGDGWRVVQTGFGLPEHIWQQLPAHLQQRYRAEQLRQPPVQ